MADESLVRPKLPLKTRLFIAVLSAATDACRRPNGTVNRRLLRVLDTKTPPRATPRHGVRTGDLTVSPSLRLRLFVPVAGAHGGDKLPLIVFFHGGGFAYLSAFSWAYDAVCRRIARETLAVVASVDYRLSPEHRHPAQYDDGLAALRFLDSNALDLADPEAAAAIDFSSCFLAGDSAGGNLAHHVAARWAATSPWERVRLLGVVAIQPWFGGEERTPAEVRLAKAPLVSTARTDWLWKAFLPEGADRDHEACNVFGPRAATLPAGFPAVVVVVGGFDPLQDWQRRYAEGLRERGLEVRVVEFPEAIHAFYVFPELPESGKVIEVMKEFIQTRRGVALKVEKKN